MKRSKYGNKKTVIDGVTFDSKAEARRWQELVLLERAGQIRDLQRQVRYELLPSVKYIGAARALGPCTYVADFTYTEQDKMVIEDCKGMETDVFKLKRRLMKQLHGLEIRITK